ncbi:RNA polymerase-associated protein RapA [compost metagenome]
MDERFEWLEIPEDDEPAAPTTAGAPTWDAGRWALDKRVPASPAAQALVEMGVDLPVRRVEMLPAFGAWPAESLALYRVRLAGERLRLASGFDRLLCLDEVKVQHLEHQHLAALRALRDMRGRAILADEVGLGKTIEAGIVLKELLLRGLAHRVLVLVPASLTVQWQQELEDKFGEPFTVVKEPDDWSGTRLVASLDMAKHPRHAAHALANAYDLLIVDEAHKLKRSTTQAYQFVNRLTKRYVLLLTATPVQNDLVELYNLVNILQPGQLGTVRAFKDSYMDAGDPRTPKNEGRLRDLLAEVMIRHRRSTIGLRLPPRRAGVYHLNLPPEERFLYDGLTAYIRDEFVQNPEKKYLRLVLATLQRELCSSPQSVAGTLRKLIADPDHDEYGRARLREFLEAAESIGVSRKSRATAELLEQFPDEQVLIFTEFRPTLEHLADYLGGLGHEVVTFHGGMSPEEKERAVERFKAGARVLVSTESGAEGRNLQFCHHLINYDLPWNPMRVEQRIGRLHRLGQTKPVKIFNLSTNDTVEAYLVQLLAHKIRLFELVVGELDLILGEIDAKKSFEELLHEAWRQARSDEDLETGFAALGDRLVQARSDYHGVKVANERLGELLEGVGQ